MMLGLGFCVDCLPCPDCTHLCLVTHVHLSPVITFVCAGLSWLPLVFSRVVMVRINLVFSDVVRFRPAFGFYLQRIFLTVSVQP